MTKCTVNVRGETMSVLYRALLELVSSPPSWGSAGHNARIKTWADVKVLWSLRAAWLKDGYSETTETKSELEHWYGLLAATMDPRSA